ncbi:MAG: hypothetical protein ACREC6_03565 [Hyphomicrobiaceae bacterium]
MKFRLFLAAGSTAAFLAVEAVAAVTITNRDDREHKILIIEGDIKKEYVLKPSSEPLKDVCSKGCIVRLNDDETDEYELEGTEAVVIEENALYHDGPDVPVESTPAPGKDAAPKDGVPKKP